MLAALVTYYLAGALAALYVAVAVRLARACSGRVASALLVLCAILSLAGAAAVVRHDGSYDFAAFHAGGALVGTQELYVDEALIRDETAVKGGFVHMPFFRLPSYGLLLKPLTWLPVPTARALWFAINAAGLVGSIVLWPNLGVAARIVASACFFPVYYTLLIGQDSALFLFLAAVATRCLVVRRDVAGGLALSLCAIKFSLGVALPVVLLAHRRWAAIASAAFGVAVQLVLSLVVQGPSWPRQYVAAFRSPAADVADFMPNLRGLFHWLPYATGLEVAGGVAILCLLYRSSRRSRVDVALAGGLAAGQLLSHHGYAYDAVVLVPLLAIGLGDVRTRPWTAALLPPVWFVVPRLLPLVILVVAGHMTVIGLALALIVVTARR
jgi:Glycosyltransferase family 87